MSDSLLSNVAGFAAFGFGVRTFQLGLLKRPIFSSETSHRLETHEHPMREDRDPFPLLDVDSTRAELR
ncbi:hypothetical protein A1Q1_02935 [Trichosporon asahii var. asahii CBS 2479]|uniref:Uncharacterized protein n=1 Tax=Trichosporon asahii var. asahii (strain ATCC 90039 / CBS 2479 / JCM 2466 / KCTC 7840 / NBRC 103889/ NCYC 2677 / UAMH 7654) TaxID=1186058 RepID=J6ETZ5_TRIAS|nr:hypothetical protein A1Q1_02935 [Trichosporon asahii var. asahii CBS 2479]EJT48019.1 hypothetical protein A1Q1_02935 [Trichosporon asahii var. asahii CBS 2479]